MAQRGVLNFARSRAGRPSFFQKYPKLIWGYQPSLEQQVAQYSELRLPEDGGKPAALNGNSDTIPGADNGKPRVYGVIHTTDPGQPGLRQAADQIKA